MVRENTPRSPIPDPLESPTISVHEAARLLGIGRSLAYEGVKRGEIPAVRVGRTVRVPTAKLLNLLGLLEVEA
jgi:excisionase family DNA binding protein